MLLLRKAEVAYWNGKEVTSDAYWNARWTIRKALSSAKSIDFASRESQIAELAPHLCSTCIQIFVRFHDLSSFELKEHHSTAEEIRKAAEEGCPLCKELLYARNRVLERIPNRNEKPGQWNIEDLGESKHDLAGSKWGISRLKRHVTFMLSPISDILHYHH